VAAGREQLESVVSSHLDILRERYGPDPDRAFREVEDMEKPSMAKMFSAEALEEMKPELAKARAAKEAAEKRGRLGGKEREKLQLLRAEEKARKLRHEHRKRSHESRKGAKKR
jgi:hypothetical protein